MPSGLVAEVDARAWVGGSPRTWSLCDQLNRLKTITLRFRERIHLSQYLAHGLVDQLNIDFRMTGCSQFVEKLHETNQCETRVSASVHALRNECRDPVDV